MGLHDVGPVVIVQRTPAGRVATPEMTFDSDVFRCVIAGSFRRGAEVVAMGDTQLHPSGYTWTEVVAGPDGLDEVIIIGDRRGATPRATGAGDDWASTVTSLLESLASGLPALIAV
jgi:hypothetical protein